MSIAIYYYYATTHYATLEEVANDSEGVVIVNGQQCQNPSKTVTPTMKVALTYYKAPHSTSVPCLLAPSYKGTRELLVAEANEVLSEE